MSTDFFDLTPSHNRDLFRSLIGKRVVQVARLLNMEPTSYERNYSLGHDDVFSLGTGPLLIDFEGWGRLFINRHPKIESLIVRRMDAPDPRLSDKFFLSVDDFYYGDSELSSMIGEKLLSVGIYKLKKQDFIYKKFPFEVGVLFDLGGSGILPSFGICNRKFADFIVAKKGDLLDEKRTEVVFERV